VIDEHDNSDLILEIESRTERLAEVRNFVSAAALDFGFAEEETATIALAVDEACTNIIKHAYRNNPGGRIKLGISTSAKRHPGRFTVTIVDNGLAFDSEHYKPPDMREYFRKPRKGGLGIVLIRKLMDEVEYSASPGAPNAIRLSKYLKARRAPTGS